MLIFSRNHLCVRYSETVTLQYLLLHRSRATVAVTAFRTLFTTEGLALCAPRNAFNIVINYETPRTFTTINKIIFTKKSYSLCNVYRIF